MVWDQAVYMYGLSCLDTQARILAAGSTLLSLGDSYHKGRSRGTSHAISDKDHVSTLPVCQPDIPGLIKMELHEKQPGRRREMDRRELRWNDRRTDGQTAKTKGAIWFLDAQSIVLDTKIIILCALAQTLWPQTCFCKMAANIMHPYLANI